MTEKMDFEQVEGIGWCLIPPHIISREDLSSSQKLIYGRLQGLTGKKGYCFAKNRWIGSQLCLKKDTISALLSDLQKKDLIRMEVVKSNDGEVVERRIYLHHPYPPNSGTLPDENKGGTRFSSDGYPIFIREGEPEQTQAASKDSDGFGKGSVDNSVDNSVEETLNNNMASPSGDNLPTEKSNLSTSKKLSIKRRRTTPLPPPEPVAKAKLPPNPIRIAGGRLMRASKDGSVGFLDVFRKVYNVRLPMSQYWASATSLGQMLLEMNIEEARIRSALAWYAKHYNDEYVPQFTTAYQFKEKFLQIEKAMNRRNSNNGNRDRHFSMQAHEVDWEKVSRFSKEKRRS